MSNSLALATSDLLPVRYGYSLQAQVRLTADRPRSDLTISLVAELECGSGARPEAPRLRTQSVL